MKKVLEDLQNWGCDVNGALQRCVDDEDIYVSLLDCAIEDDQFRMLHEEVLKEEITQTFEIAHSLKGVYGNLGITPMYSNLSQMVEILRKNKFDGVAELEAELNQLFIQFREIVEKAK